MRPCHHGLDFFLVELNIGAVRCRKRLFLLLLLSDFYSLSLFLLACDVAEGEPARENSDHRDQGGVPQNHKGVPVEPAIDDGQQKQSQGRMENQGVKRACI